MSIDESALRLGESLRGEIGFVSTCLGTPEDGVPTIFVFLRRDSTVILPTEWEGFPVQVVPIRRPLDPVYTLGMKRKTQVAPILQPPKRFRTKWPEEPMTVREAKAIVRAALKVLNDMAKGWRGGVRPETKEAFRVVLKAASR